MSPAIIQPIFASLLGLLQSTICLVGTIRCLNRVQPHLSPPQLADAHGLITMKYPPWVGIHDQVQQILGYNSSLLSPFLELMEVVEQWYKGVMEHHECCWKEGFLFLLDHTHALSSIPPDNISVSHDDKLSKIYDLTNMAREHQELAQLLLD